MITNPVLSKTVSVSVVCAGISCTTSLWIPSAHGFACSCCWLVYAHLGCPAIKPDFYFYFFVTSLVNALDLLLESIQWKRSGVCFLVRTFVSSCFMWSTELSDHWCLGVTRSSRACSPTSRIVDVLMILQFSFYFTINLWHWKYSSTSKIKDTLENFPRDSWFILVFVLRKPNYLPNFYVVNWFTNQFSFIRMLKLLDSSSYRQWDLEEL